MPQFTIRQLMISVAAVAFVLAICFASAFAAFVALYACVLIAAGSTQGRACSR
jgi:hypothetical protein